MTDIMFDLIKDKICKDFSAIPFIKDSGNMNYRWNFDFKGQCLSRLFLEEYANHFWKVFRERYGNVVQVGGMETGALSMVAAISILAPKEVLVKGFYIRKSRKKSDLANIIEGEILSDIPIILVDDILNSGATLYKQIKILEEVGKRVSAIFVCLRFRDMSYYQEFLNRGIVLISIFELDDFKSVLPVNNLVSKDVSSLTERYVCDYRVVLAKTSNPYFVAPKSAPILVGEYLYVGLDDGSFCCVHAGDGNVVWTYRVFFGASGKYIISSPVVYRDRVIFGAYDGNVYCLDRFSGKRLWTCIDADWVGSSPCVDEKRGVVYIGLEFGLFNKCGGIVALEISTGKTLWKQYNLPGFVHASPAYSRKNHVVVCGCNDGYLYAFQSRTGKMLWKFKTNGEIRYGAIFDEERNLVIFGSMDGGVYVLHAQDGTLYHRFEAHFGFYSNPVLDHDRVIIGSLDKNVYCFGLSSKHVEWIFETSGRIFASPLLEGNSVFIGSNDGRLYELNVQTGKEIARIQFPERIVNRVQISRDSDGSRLIYVLTHMGEIYRMRSMSPSC